MVDAATAAASLKSPTRALGAARLLQSAVQQATDQMQQESLCGSAGSTCDANSNWHSSRRAAVGWAVQQAHQQWQHALYKHGSCLQLPLLQLSGKGAEGEPVSDS
jgi:hypothetical protein